MVTVAALGKPSLEVLLDATIEHALARATRLVLSRCTLPGPARAVHACPNRRAWGWEEWDLDADLKVKASRGWFDADDYARQTAAK